MQNQDNLLDVKRQAIKELLIQAKKSRDKPLYKKLKLKYRQIQAGTNKEEIDQDVNTE